MEKFGNFGYEEKIVVGQKTNIFIADIPLSPDLNDYLSALGKSSERNIIVYDAAKLSDGLLKLLKLTDKPAQEQVALFFPGEGANQVMKYLVKKEPDFMDSLQTKGQIYQFPCERKFYPGTSIPSEVKISLPSEFQPQNYDRIVVVDDVVASGETISEINRAAYKLLPQGEQCWISMEAFAWLALDSNRRKKMTGVPNSIAPSSVLRIDNIQSVIAYDGVSGIPPCNSLSTIAKGDKKASVVIAGLKSKYFNVPMFDSFINFLQQEYGKRNR